MTRTELEIAMASKGKTGLLINTETKCELLLAQIDELTEANANQRERILGLEAENGRLHEYLEGLAKLNAEASRLRVAMNQILAADDLETAVNIAFGALEES